jgi:hypothetical protein
VHFEADHRLVGGVSGNGCVGVGRHIR